MQILFHSPDPAAILVEGIPDLGGTRSLCFGLAIPCAVFAIWLPIAGGPRAASTGNPTLVLLLILAAAALALGLAVGLVRAGLRSGAWFRVTPDGIDYGSGTPGDGQAPYPGQRRIDWKRIVRNPERAYDIGIANEIYGVAPNARMTFWYRKEDGSLAERSLPLQLRDDVLRCLRFCNAHDVRVALLRHLAANPDLRFDADVFVRAGVDPETWARMPGPRRASWLAAARQSG